MSSHTENNPLAALSEAMTAAAARAGAAIVTVKARQRMPATGVAFAPDLILTANHVVEQDEDIRLVLPDGSEVLAQVAGRDPGSDLAVLHLEKPLATAAIPAEQEAQIGQLVLALGRPFGRGLEASLGVISAVGGALHFGHGHGANLERHIRTDAIFYPGFSGGPLVSAAGEVVGINTSGLARGAPLTIPVDLAWKIARSLAEHGSLKRGYLGVRSQLVEIPESMRPALGRDQAAALLLVGIEPDSPAAQAGLIVGDILVGIAGSPVNDHDELLGALTGDAVGRAIPLQILRGGQLIIVQVTATERSHEDDSSHGHPRHMRFRFRRP